MDELAGLIGGLIGVIVVIAAVAWLIAIAIAIIIGVTVVAGPPLGLGTILKRLLTKRYTLSRRKKWQCAGVASLAFALPFLSLLVDSSLTSWLAVGWTGTVMSMSSMAAFLSISAYQQHFAQHRRSIREARRTLKEESFRHKLASMKLWWMNRTLNRVERKHGGLIRAREELTAQMDTLIENNDPALCRIKMSHWESQYSTLPPKRLVAELDVVAREFAITAESQQAPLLLHSRFLEELIVRRKLAGSQTAARFHELKSARDELQAELAGCAETMNACKRVQVEEKATIVQLKNQRLVIK